MADIVPLSRLMPAHRAGPTAPSCPIYVGVDVGSASVNVVGVDGEGQLVGRPNYTKVASHPTPVDAVKASFRLYMESLPSGVQIAGAGTTGSGRELNKHIIGGELTRTEIFAHAMGISELVRQGRLVVGENGSTRTITRVGTVIEIGGQDAKVIMFDDGGVPTYFNMNSICSAGTGEFLQQIADEAGIAITEYGPLALESHNACRVDATCTVFSKRDFRHLTQKGVPLPDRLMGICTAMVRNYVHNVIADHEVREPVIFQGGTAANISLVEAFRRKLQTEIIVPPLHDVMGAFGMAIIVRDHLEGRDTLATQFKDDFFDRTYDSQVRFCHGCQNACDLTQPLEVAPTGEQIILDTMGGRCDGYTKPGNLREMPQTLGKLNIPVNRQPRPSGNVFDIVRPGAAQVRESVGRYFGGIDGGSRGTKCALLRSLGEKVEVFFVGSVDTSGNAIQALLGALEKLRDAMPGGAELSGVGTTGSAGELFRDVITTKAEDCADYRSTEILAHYAWASYNVPNVGTVMDIGGNDAKIIAVKEGGLDFAMNDKCAAGTGAFVEAVAKRFDTRLEDYAKVAFTSKNPARVAGRCAVFGESDIIHKARVGFPKEDLFMGLAHAICKTYFSDVAKGKAIRVPIVVQGGTFLNEAVQAAFRENLGLSEEEFVIYPDRRFVVGAGALGAALLAKGMYERGHDSAFKGFDRILGGRFTTLTTDCTYGPCSRKCRGVVALLENDQVIAGYKSIDCDFGMFAGLAQTPEVFEHMQHLVDQTLHSADKVALEVN